MSKSRWAVLVVIAALLAAFFVFDLGQHLNLATLKSRQADLQAFYEGHRLLTVGLFFLTYVAVTGFPCPARHC